MKKILLTHNKTAIIDDEDYPLVSQYKWYASRGRNTWYAQTSIKGTTVLMHRLILGLVLGDKIQTDHINHNGLNNCRKNIRKCTHTQNHRNRQPNKKGTSIYKGICWDINKKKWRSQLTIFNCNHYLGLFEFEIDAARAYDIKAKELFGDFAFLNFP